MSRLLRRSGRHRGAGGGGGSGNGPDDLFDFGSSIDTAGARYPGAYPWTIQNALSATNAVSGGILTITDPGFRSGMSPILAMQAMDSGDGAWRVRVATGAGGNYSGLGVALRESATGKILLHGFAYDNPGASPKVQVRRLTSYTVWTSNYGSIGTADLNGYAEIVRDGSTLIFIYSEDNVTWTEIARATQTVDFTTAPDQVGLWFVPSDGAPGAQWGDFYEFLYKNRAVPYDVPLQNPGAESGTAGWTNVTNTLTTRGDIHHSGGATFAITSIAAFECYTEWKAVGFDSLIDAGGGGGVTATLAGWGRPWEGASSSFHIRLNALDSGGSSLGSSSTANWSPSASYSQKSCTLALPSGTRKLRVTYEGTCTAGTDCWLDDLTLSLA